MRFYIIYFSLILSTIGTSLLSQPLERKDIPFFVNSRQLKYPMTGGINNAQVSQGDLNFDGILDLLIFDKNGNVLLPFIFNGKTGKYDFMPEMGRQFPRVLDWVLLKDYNKDGIIDLFSSSFNTQGPAGIEVYKGTNVNGFLQFQIASIGREKYNILYWPTGGNQYTQIPVDYIDYPSIDDIDQDGDLDILTFTSGGSYIQWFKNISKERGWSLDSLQFILQDECYGRFVENGLSSEIKLSPTADSCASYFTKPNNQIRHSGSTILSCDLNGDPLRDLLIGDVSNNAMIGLFNGGSSTTAWMNKEDNTWPSNSTPINMNKFNSAFEVDFNLDGHLDILVAPNQRYQSENINNLWYYQNKPINNKPNFTLTQKNLLIEDMLDFGSAAHPCFVDYNQDGLTDLLIGTEGFYSLNNSRDPRLVLFKNIGTLKSPQYELVDSNYLNFKQFGEGINGTSNFTPSFGDLDGDGDLDMLTGESQGGFFYSENIAGSGKEFVFKQAIYDYFQLSARSYSVPYLVDLNRDGLTDIVAGSLLSNNDINRIPCGSFYYFQNQGTKNSPLFDPDYYKSPNTNCLGNIILQGVGSKVYSAPTLYDANGKYLMFSGGLLGETSVFSHIEGNLYNKFSIEYLNYGQLREGENTHLSVADIDDDGVLDMVVGNQRGGFSIFSTTYKTDGTIVSSNDVHNNEFRIYPNPAQHTITFKCDQNTISGILKIIDLNGAVISSIAINDLNKKTLDVSNFKSGCYVLKFQSGTQFLVSKFIKI